MPFRTVAHHPSGSTQAPLLEAAQLLPGTFLTGVAFERVWRVEALDVTGVTLQQVVPPPALAVACLTHDASNTVTTSTLSRCERCGWAREATSALLPLPGATPPVARGVIITPVHTAVDALAPYTVYLIIGGEGGPQETVATDGDGHLPAGLELPLVPQVVPVWTLPPALQAILRAGRDMPLTPGPPNTPGITFTPAMPGMTPVTFTP